MKLAAVALALSLALSGCLVKKSTHQKALDHITDLEGRIANLEREEAERKERLRLLDEELGKARGDLESRDQDLSKVRGEKEATVAELEVLRRQRDAQEQRLAAYRDLQNKFRALVDSGKLEIGFRNGQMVVKLPSSILFASGASELSAAGKAALADVTKVLLEFQDRRFLIAGHTDNVPIKTRTFRNNWVLSTARAVSVLEFMIAQGMPAANVAAAGYADQDPVAANDSEPNKELNRRIEIILVPNLSELPSLVDPSAAAGG
jgi:chemotaxis protein MotB